MSHDVEQAELAEERGDWYAAATYWRWAAGQTDDSTELAVYADNQTRCERKIEDKARGR